MISVAIATLGRPERVRQCVESVLACDPPPGEVLVVDQSPGDSTRRALEPLSGARLRYVHQLPPGLSRARNRAIREARGDYVMLLDDDADVPPGWIGAIESEIRRFGGPDALYGEIRAPEGFAPDGKAVPVSTFSVEEPRVWEGLVHPSRLGYGGHMAVRRSTWEALGGFDERLGAGSPLYGAEDMDFNYRLMKAGYRAASTPAVWMIHDQWRGDEDLPRLFYRYNLGHSAFCAKHLRGGDRYALRLFLLQVRDDLKMLASALRRRSVVRARIAARRTAGTWTGLVRGWREIRDGHPTPEVPR